MNITKRIMTVLLALFLLLSSSVMMASAATAGMSNFTKVNTYSNGRFSDVNANDWFADNVAKTYECGIMIGVSDKSFAPSNNVSLAEVITIAARIHSCYNNGSYTFRSSDPWYKSYADYLYSNGVISKRGNYSINNLDRIATRGNVADILGRALPEAELQPINSTALSQIPDVKATASYADEVLLFYKAGIVNGKDSTLKFEPDSNITRAETAAIISRMIDSSLRKKVLVITNTQDYIYSYLTNTMGLNKVVACAVMGNICQESKYNPKAYNSSGGYYGLIQWGGSRKSNLQSYCSKNGLDYTTAQGQMEFFNYEVNNGYYKQFMDYLRPTENKHENLAGVTEYFMRKIEGTTADLSKRLAYAEENWNRY